MPPGNNKFLQLQSADSFTSLKETNSNSIDSASRLRVFDGNSRFGGDAQVTGRMAIGGEMDDNYRLRVCDGNSRFGGMLR